MSVAPPGDDARELFSRRRDGLRGVLYISNSCRVRSAVVVGREPFTDVDCEPKRRELELCWRTGD